MATAKKAAAADTAPKEENKLKAALKELESKYGKGTVVNAREMMKQYVSTGSLLLDKALGTGGGLVMGKLVEIFGPQGSGKSTIALHVIANIQQQYPAREVVFMNGEHAFDPDYAVKLGVDLDRLIIAEYKTAEAMYNGLLKLVETGEVRGVVIDSHTSFQPNAIMTKEIGETTIAPHGRTNSVALGKLKGAIARNRTLCVAISQLRTALGGYHVSDKSTGGNAWNFYPDIRISLAKSIDVQGKLTRVTATVMKNKLGGELMAKAEYDIVWGKGIDRLGEIVDIAVELGIISKAGSWYSYGDSKIGQGRDAVKQFLYDNVEFYEQLQGIVEDKLKDGKTKE